MHGEGGTRLTYVKLTIGVKSYAGTGKSNLSNSLLWRAPGPNARKRNCSKVGDVSGFSIWEINHHDIQFNGVLVRLSTHEMLVNIYEFNIA